MTNVEITANPQPDQNNRELTQHELEAVSAGGKSNGNAAGHTYLVFNFKLVAVKTISWSY
jgi:hypothetical protein